MDKVLGQRIQFNNKKILQQALTHRSATKRNNERLEFLGDSILGFVITKWLYVNYQNLSEGKLSRIRSNLVKGDTLAEVARHFNIGEQLILGIGELKSGGHNRASVLADVVEAIFAAVFIDQGIDKAEDFILTVMHNWLSNIDPNISDKDAKTRLQEHLQKLSMNIPTYKLIKQQGQDHLQTFTMQCEIVELDLRSSAMHKSRKRAEQQAAQNILDKIDIDL
ncbi:MAG: ribonuclease III [Proteobacteria bacterium]|nr:ribonuclease III [Pseudomonadota bacterium]